MATIQASEFKAKCLALMEQVAATGETLVITKNGRPVAELHRYTHGRADSPFGLHRGLRIIGDVMAPVGQQDWEALT
jgi:antitoxin (DNA-binding transcriptional repressor) of toxin-antitoxin stability system